MQSIHSFQKLLRIFRSSNIFIVELFDTFIYKGSYYLKKGYDYKCNIENLNLQSYVIVYIPQLNSIIFILKGLISSSCNMSFLSTVYKVYLKNNLNNLFTTNFHTLDIKDNVDDDGSLNTTSGLNLDTETETETDNNEEIQYNINNNMNSNKNKTTNSILIYTVDDDCILIDQMYTITTSISKSVYGKLPENIEKLIRNIFISEYDECHHEEKGNA